MSIFTPAHCFLFPTNGIIPPQVAALGGGMLNIFGKIGGIAAVLVTSLGGALAAELPMKAAPVEPLGYPMWVNVFGGVTVAPQSVYGEAGAVIALNRNLDVDGFLFRFKGGGGEYEYNRAVGFRQTVSFETGDIMIGYQKFIGGTRLSGYLGANVENHDNNDPLAKVRGTQAGVKAQGEIYAPIADRWYFFALGNISSVFTNYYTVGKLGYKLTDVISFGPEISALGNDRFDAVRAGPFVAFNITPVTQIILSGGYSWDTRRNLLNDHSGGYGTIHVRSNF